MDSCFKDNIKVFLVYAPEYYELQHLITNSDSLLNIYSNFAQKYKTVFLDYSKDPISQNKELFYNSQHLNRKGSEVFSIKLANDLKELISNH